MKLSKVVMPIMVGLFVTVFSISVFAAEPPKSVTTAFNKAFPKAQKVSWGKEELNYEADYVMDGEVMSAIYSPNGELIETHTELNMAQVPKAVLIEIEKSNPKGNTRKFSKVQRGSKLMYEVKIRGREMLYTPSGEPTK